MKSSITILIPTYNGLELLKKHLHSVIEHSQSSTIIIVDDASTDDSVNWIRQKFPQIKLIPNPKNIGFAASVNKGFIAASSELVLLLNNDVTINQKTIPTLLKHFKNDNLFAVGALEKLPGKEKRGKSRGWFEKGLMMHSPAKTLEQGPTLWVFGASGLFNRKIWNNLGGLDELYRPAYWEDIDISYRAWKTGFTCAFEPAATVNHESEATMTNALGNKKAAYAFKNQLLFFWKNIHQPRLILQHFLWMPYHLTITTIRTKGAFLWGFCMALCQLSEVMKQTSRYTDKRTDDQVIKLSSF